MAKELAARLGECEADRDLLRTDITEFAASCKTLIEESGGQKTGPSPPAR
jgi:hypothetical protein